MTSRKKKLRLIQLILLITGIIIIFSTYYKKENVSNTQKNSELIKKENQTNAKIEDGESDVFFNIEYTGLDLNGNRYILRSEEAQLENERPEIVYMKEIGRASCRERV